jgi:hypothetical protein
VAKPWSLHAGKRHMAPPALAQVTAMRMLFTLLMGLFVGVVVGGWLGAQY